MLTARHKSHRPTIKYCRSAPTPVVRNLILRLELYSGGQAWIKTLSERLESSDEVSPIVLVHPRPTTVKQT